MYLNIICIVIAIISMVILYLYKRQIKLISRQLRFINQKDSNLQIALTVQFYELLELVDELNHNNEFIRNKSIDVERKDRELKQAITYIAHDIRTPLTSLNGYFELLQETKDKEEQQKYVLIIKERIDCLKQMLDELFTYSKLQNGEYNFDYEKVDIKEILCKTIFTFYNDMKFHNIEPKIELPEDQVFINSNTFALMRIFQNIIKNCLDHGCKEITIQMKDEEKHVVISFSNPLMEGEVIDPTRVFERFYKGDNTKCQTSTGLGLAIAHDMVEKMFGTIKAYTDHQRFYIKIDFKK